MAQDIYQNLPLRELHILIYFIERSVSYFNRYRQEQFSERLGLSLWSKRAPERTSGGTAVGRGHLPGLPYWLLCSLCLLLPLWSQRALERTSVAAAMGRGHLPGLPYGLLCSLCLLRARAGGTAPGLSQRLAGRGATPLDAIRQRRTMAARALRSATFCV